MNFFFFLAFLILIYSSINNNDIDNNYNNEGLSGTHIAQLNMRVHVNSQGRGTILTAACKIYLPFHHTCDLVSIKN